MLKLGMTIGLLLVGTTTAFAQGDVAAGEALFGQRCQVCHLIGEGATNKLGPQLNGIVGAPVARLPGYSYSPTLIRANEAGRIWTVTDLRRYMFLPKKQFPGTSMTFGGQRDPVQLSDLVAYLQSFAADGTRIAP
ncbi:cytochrome c [Devosia sp. UYZn731]|uniref:c-type cytochrome n=1 Tax=Devosia sp. UYZn731 TaxID=3156345 RepID=UPI0033981865